MLPNPKQSLDKLCQAFKEKLKLLKKPSKHLKTSSSQEETSASHKKQLILESSKTTNKILKTCIELLISSNSKTEILKSFDFVIKSFIDICSKHNSNVSEKTFRKTLTCCNIGLSFVRNYNGLLSNLNYVSRAFWLVKDKGVGFVDVFEKLAKFYLNACSVCLEMKKYLEGVRWAEESLKYLQNVSKFKSFGGEESALDRKEIVSGYVLAFYCIFFAQHKLGRSDLAYKALTTAVEIGKIDLDHTSTLYSTVLNLSQVQASPKKYLFHLELSALFADFQFIDKQSQEKVKTEEKRPGRYYTKSQLEVKKKLLKNSSALNFISADEYFFHEISKSIYLNPVQTSVKPSENLNKRAWIRAENLEKRKISELRLKKQYRSSSTSPGHALTPHFIIKPLTDSCSSHQSHSDRLLKIQTSEKFKTLLTKICAFKKPQKILPSQKLFFKPKLSSAHTIDTQCNSEVKLITDSQRRHSLYEATRDEIEDFMNEINHEIQVMHSERDNSKLTSPSICCSVRSLKESLLGKSALKSSKLPENHFFQLKSSINSSLKARRRKVLRRKSTLKDLQV